MQNHISIIIPVYNRNEEIQRAILSVLKQSYQHFEIIIVDDNSSQDIKKSIDVFNDNRIVYIKNKENHGVSYSRNVGMKASKYDLIALLDSDDEWLPGKLEEQIKYLIENINYNLVHTEEIWIRNGMRVNQKKKHRKSGGDIFIPSLELCFMSPSSILIKKEIFTKYGMFDEELPVCEDYDMWLRILASEEAGFIETPLIKKYGGHSDQLSKRYHSMDKYRVLSMLKLLNNTKLNKQREKALKNMIIRKSKILLNGAIKRDNQKNIEIYREWIKKCS